MDTAEGSSYVEFNSNERQAPTISKLDQSLQAKATIPCLALGLRAVLSTLYGWTKCSKAKQEKLGKKLARSGRQNDGPKIFRLTRFCNFGQEGELSFPPALGERNSLHHDRIQKGYEFRAQFCLHDALKQLIANYISSTALPMFHGSQDIHNFMPREF